MEQHELISMYMRIVLFKSITTAGIMSAVAGTKPRGSVLSAAVRGMGGKAQL